ncbi:hypothetical protein Sru01_15950 [Sphaerisporangium rufum]|uniref:VWA domain-containing protein n=1 Tax=Sphaerisporangium rufum TaxID=1381558 RepID=A0A919R099_9ACTN|nr:hypothetical protein [Sphaerisporangium rufum]GII76613.1 hypothetical protein Sru01_15950 [Sphaerisporangium rufum]
MRAFRTVVLLLPVVLVLLAAVTLLAGCQASPPPPAAARPCGMAVDATSFSRNTDVQRKIDEAVPRFLAECDQVAFGVVNGSPGATDCRQAPLDLVAGPKDNPNDNPKRAAQVEAGRRGTAIAAMKRLLACSRAEKQLRPGSDVIGAVRYLTDQLGALERSGRLLVLSDLGQRTPELDVYHDDLSTPDRRARYVDRVADRLPKLAGARIQVVGFGIHLTGDPARRQHIQEFWTLLFDRCGALAVTYT